MGYEATQKHEEAIPKRGAQVAENHVTHTKRSLPCFLMTVTRPSLTVTNCRLSKVSSNKNYSAI